MRCETCGARNPADAAWCTQCYATFQDPAPAVDPSPTAADDPAAAAATDVRGSPVDAPGGAADGAADDLVDATPGVSGDASARPGVSAAPSAEPPDAAEDGPATDRDIREVDGQVEWRCATCASWMPLEAAVCGTCGAVRTGFGEPATPPPTAAPVASGTVLGTSAVAPGLGHLLAGRTGSGITRLLLWALWVGGGLWWVLSTQNGRGPGLVLLLGAVILWGVTFIDADAIAKGRPTEPFGVRGLLWTVVGVTGLLMLVVAFAAAGSLGG